MMIINFEQLLKGKKLVKQEVEHRIHDHTHQVAPIRVDVQPGEQQPQHTELHGVAHRKGKDKPPRRVPHHPGGCKRPATIPHKAVDQPRHITYDVGRQVGQTANLQQQGYHHRRNQCVGHPHQPELQELKQGRSFIFPKLHHGVHADRG